MPAPCAPKLPLPSARNIVSPDTVSSGWSEPAHGDPARGGGVGSLSGSAVLARYGEFARCLHQKAIERRHRQMKAHRGLAMWDKCDERLAARPINAHAHFLSGVLRGWFRAGDH